MKTASGIIALILGLLTMLNIASCSKADREFNAFVAYSNSAPGAIEGFARGWSGANQGDPFGAVLDITDKERALRTDLDNARWAAWVCLIGTAVAMIVCGAIPAKQSALATRSEPMRQSSSSIAVVPTQASSAPPEAKHTIEERLRTLRQLKEAGLITAEEFEARSRQVVEAI